MWDADMWGSVGLPRTSRLAATPRTGPPTLLKINLERCCLLRSLGSCLLVEAGTVTLGRFESGAELYTLFR